MSTEQSRALKRVVNVMERARPGLTWVTVQLEDLRTLLQPGFDTHDEWDDAFYADPLWKAEGSLDEAIDRLSTMIHQRYGMSGEHGMLHSCPCHHQAIEMLIAIRTAGFKIEPGLPPEAIEEQNGSWGWTKYVRCRQCDHPLGSHAIGEKRRCLANPWCSCRDYMPSGSELERADAQFAAEIEEGGR